MDYLDPLELCPNDPAKGERVKVAVHALMLNPNDMPSRFILLQYGFGDDALNYTGKFPVFEKLRYQDRELFELANQVAMAFCCYKLAQSIYKYDRYKYSLKSFIGHMYYYAKKTVEGYAKNAPGAKKKSDFPEPVSIREYEVKRKAEDKDDRDYHTITQWADAVTAVLSGHQNVFGNPVNVDKTKQTGGVTVVVVGPDGSRHKVKTGYTEEQLLYIEFDMSLDECQRAIAFLKANGTKFYNDAAPKQHDTLSAAEFDSFRLYYLEHSAKNTFNQVVNNEVNLEIGRLYLLERSSLAGILDTLGADYPERVAEKMDGRANAKKPEPLTRIKVRGRIYQNIKPMLDNFMKEREGCISEEEKSLKSEAREGSSACDI